MTVPKITLNNNVQIPQLGMGVFKMQDHKQFIQAFQWAIEIGYRHFDTAAIYGNEKWLGEAIKKAGIKREELFITSKLWPAEFDNPQKAYENSLKRLGLDYLDLYLIHWPAPDYEQAWQAMEQLYQDHAVRAIGVSNFMIKHLEKLQQQAQIMPAVDQVELHPYLQRPKLLAYLQDNDIAVEAWGPLGQGINGVFAEPILQNLAQKYHKSVAQVILRWHLQRHAIIFPKSIHQERLQQNFDIFDFELSTDDMNAISTLDKNQPNGSDPNDDEHLAQTKLRPVIN
ncbi:aldo/keto reductase [Bombilactobacillus bombi]|uniref:aldo/keto reductase n=1 Tax=Bombilactobacillus bombi TaxID=1303590 RepID=UPI0015E5D53B|nr:aldo/keto reductase [Bombilactobacillus bombi]MBA1393233.1 aldo/keto reductase [Lactobacillus sp. XV13L]MBA1434808.1 aldo/keto reductase [Bombilactobacillus bombi]